VPLGDAEKRYFSVAHRRPAASATPTGFEMGSGMSINPVLPEDAAIALRSVAP
jgi:hypothetical protein